MQGMVIQMNTRTIRTYNEAMHIADYLERYRYLRLGGTIGRETFGFDRYLNQSLYRSGEWKRFRRDIILRDNGCDLACEGYAIVGKILIHHIEPITMGDIVNRDSKIFDPNNVICVSLDTHNAIHFGDERLLVTGPIERRPNDTCPWKR